MLTNLTSASLVVVSLSSSSSSSLPPYCLLRSTAASLLSPCPLPRPMPSPLRPLRRPLWRPPNQPHLVPFIPSLPRSDCLQRRATPPPPPYSIPPVHPPARETARCRTTEPPHVPTLPLPGRLQSSSSPVHPLSPPHRSARRPLTARFALRDSALGSLLSFNCRLSFSLPLSTLPSLPCPLSLCRSTPFPLFFPALPLPRDARCNPLRANQHTRKPRAARASERASE